MGILSPLVTFFAWMIGSFVDFFTQRLYTSKIVFNQCWEDPRLDLEALKLTPEDTMLIITSAGCNALDHVLAGAKHVYCIDRNPCQNACLELKIVAIKELDYPTFWKMWGDGLLPGFTKNVYPKLRPKLSPEAQEFWDKHSHYFDGSWFRASFYFRACSGALAWLIKVYLLAVPGLWPATYDLLRAKSVEEQKKIYHERIERKLWNPVVKKIVENSATLSGIGVPVAQQNLLSAEMNIGKFLRDSLETILIRLPIHDNYFWRVYMEGKYFPDCCPEYCKEANFEKLKKVVDNISLHTTTVSEFLEVHKGPKISKFILLDHMDWMADKPMLLRDEWQQIVENCTVNAQFLWRSAAKETQFVNDTAIYYKGQKTTVGDIVDFDRETAERLHEIDRVHTYTSFHIANLKQN